MSNTEPKAAKFLSKYLALKIVVRPTRSKEMDGQIISVDGESIRFVDGVYETSDPKEIEFLEARPEFKSGTIIRVPDDVKNLVAHEQEWRKDLEQREADLAAREAALEAKEKGIQGSEEGARVSKPEGGEAQDDLDGLNRAGLTEIAQKLELDPAVYKVGKTNDSIKEAIRAKRKELEGAGASGPAY